MIFLTVGTQFPFDRLVEAVDEACSGHLIGEEIIAQIGNSVCRPKHFEYVASMCKEEYDACFHQASAVVSHAGMGTISMALEIRKPLLVMPRVAAHGEVVHDHQVDIAEKFGEAGHVLVAWDEKQLMRKIDELRGFVPIPRVTEVEQVAARIKLFLQGC